MIKSNFSFRYYLRRWRTGYTPVIKDSNNNVVLLDDGKCYFQSNGFYILSQENLICLDILLINQTFTGTFSTSDSDNLNRFTTDLNQCILNRENNKYLKPLPPPLLVDFSKENISRPFDIAKHILTAMNDKYTRERLPEIKCEEDFAKFFSKKELDYRIDDITLYFSYKTNMKDISKKKKSKFRKFLFENSKLTLHYAFI